MLDHFEKQARRAVRNCPPLLPLLHRADAKPKAAGKRGLGQPQLLADGLDIRHRRVVDAAKLPEVAGLGGSVRVCGDLGRDFLIRRVPDLFPADTPTALTNLFGYTSDDRHRAPSSRLMQS